MTQNKKSKERKKRTMIYDIGYVKGDFYNFYVTNNDISKISASA